MSGTMKHVHIYFLCLRIFMATISWSYHIADETWQSVEVAHWLVFGNGHLTWEWKHNIRSWIHPLIFVPSLWMLKFTGMDCHTNLVALLPRITQAIISSFGDVFIYAFCHREFGTKVARWFAFLYACNRSINYYSSRTFINTMEMVLTSAALYYYPNGEAMNFPSWKYISLVTISFAMRATSALFWAPMVAYHAWRSGPRRVILEMMPPAFFVYLIAVIIDTIFYGKFVCAHINFFNVNVLQGISNFYGVQPRFWYMTTGFLELFGDLILLDVYIGFFFSLKEVKTFHLSLSFIVTLAFNSFIPHKEARFLLPIVPLGICFAAKAIAEVRNQCVSHINKNYKAFLILLFNMTHILYISMFYARGRGDVQHYISRVAVPGSSGALYLMLGHSIPWYSHVHRKINMSFPHCGPNLSRIPYVFEDEYVSILENPKDWLKAKKFGTPILYPTYVVMTNDLHESVQLFLQTKGYKKCVEIFNFLKSLESIAERIETASRIGILSRSTLLPSENVVIFCKE